MSVLAITCPSTSFVGFPVLFCEIETGRYWQPKTAIDSVRFTGSVGMVRHENNIWVAANLESGAACILKYVMNTGQTQLWELTLCSDPHSILIDGDVILVVSTANNMLVSCAFEGDLVVETMAHRFDDSDFDSVHLNALCRWEGRTLVGMFGPRPLEKPWVRAVDGRVSSLDGSFTIDGLAHPHSICVHQDKLLGVESLRNAIVDLQTGARVLRTDIGLGYMRGLTSDGKRLAYGTSHRREDRDNVNAFMLSLGEFDGASIRPIASMPGPAGYEEIYDLVFLDRSALPADRRQVIRQESDRVVVLGPQFRADRAQPLSFVGGDWGERYNLFDIPRNIIDLELKLVVMSEFPLVHLKVALSNDGSLQHFDNSIEKWIDVVGGFSIIDLDWRRFATLRGDFDPTCVRLALLGGFLTGFDGMISYQFVADSGAPIHLV